MRKPAAVERLYIDFDGFFASAEQHLQPHLRGRPVGVIPLDTPYTGLIAVSREAKRLGVRRGLSVKEARALCPEITLVPARHDQYVRLHKEIRAAVETVLPVLAVRSIDEILCALMGNERTDAVGLAQAVKAAVRRHVGSGLTCSVGLGPNELLAKIAAEMKKPDGLVMLDPRDLPGPLLDLALTDVPGIARGNAARLARAGIEDMAGFWALSPKQARAIWGNVEGERLWAGLHGYAVERPEHGRVMFGHGRVLPHAWRNPEGLQACARFLLVKAARRMRREGFAARVLALWLTDRRSAGWFGEEAFAPTFDDRSVLASLRRLFACAWAGGAPARGRSVHVALSGLVPIAAIPRDLFDFAADRQIRNRWERLSRIADRIYARYGGKALHLGPFVEPPGGYAGAKIAFGRIPDGDDF